LHKSPVGTTGRAWVFSGRDWSVLYAIDGEQDKEYFGWDVAGAGDVNHDGFGDFLVSSVSPFPTLFSGRTGAPLYRFEAGGFTAVNEAGDLNGDGFADVLVGDMGVYPYGAAYVFGGNDLFLWASNRKPKAGDLLVLTMRERPAGDPAILVMTSLDGTGTFLPVAHGQFDATLSWIVTGTVPPGLAGSIMTLQAFAMESPSGRTIDSAPETISFK
jgi:hypothetical protein